MLYENYRRKVIKLAQIVQVIKRFRILIICVAAFLLCLTATLLGIHGIVYTVSECPQTLEYGEELSFGADAVFAGVRYEYAE